jgi:hypothetical protein
MKSEARLSEKAIGVGVALAVGLILVLSFLALPGGALADTIHLEVSSPSPANPPREGTVYVTASGSASSTEDRIYIGSPPIGERCPQEYPEETARVGWDSPIELLWHPMTAPTYSYQFFFSEDSRSVVCGYLIHFVYNDETDTGKLVALASTELLVIYGPSGEEVAQKAKSEREKTQQEEAAQHKYEEEAPARQAAKETAELQAEKAAAEQAPVTFLRVKAVAHPDLDSFEAGHTTIAIATDPYAHVTIIVNHRVGTFRYRATGKGGIELRWSCGHPGITYSYVVTAVGGSGASLRRSGHFKMASAAWCAAERKRETQEVEERRRKEQSPQGKIEHAEEEYCEKVIGGIPGGFVTAAGHIYLNCRYKGVWIKVGEGVS